MACPHARKTFSHLMTSTRYIGGVVATLEPHRVSMHTQGVIDGLDGFLTVMNPAMPFGSGVSFTDAIAYTEGWGDRSAWAYPYDVISLAKAEAAWRTGLSTREILHLMPWLLQEGDTPWEGGVWLNGMVDAYSGVESPFDEAFAYTVLAWLQAGMPHGHAEHLGT